jgi:hypothetical protein
VHPVVLAATAALWLVAIATGSAYAQTSGQTSDGGEINLGGRGWSAGEGQRATPDRPANQLEFNVRGGFATDYIYRGTTLSDHKPAVGAAVEAAFAQLYAGVAVASVKLPTQLRSRRDLLPLSR